MKNTNVQAQAQAQAQAKTDVLSELEKTLEKLNASDTLAISEKKSEYNTSYIRLNYSLYRLNGTYKLMYKLVKNKLDEKTNVFKREKDIKSEKITSVMISELEKAQANNYALVLDATSELAYTRYKLANISEKIKNASEKEKNELLAQASELVEKANTLQATSELDVKTLKKELSEKLNNN